MTNTFTFSSNLFFISLGIIHKILTNLESMSIPLESNAQNDKLENWQTKIAANCKRIRQFCMFIREHIWKIVITIIIVRIIYLTWKEHSSVDQHNMRFNKIKIAQKMAWLMFPSTNIIKTFHEKNISRTFASTNFRILNYSTHLREREDEKKTQQKSHYYFVEMIYIKLDERWIYSYCVRTVREYHSPKIDNLIKHHKHKQPLCY